MKLLSSAIAATAMVRTAIALATFQPMGTSGPSYQVGVPSGSAISSSNTGPIYFSLSAPSSYQWVGLGMGTQMAGATIFVMYADGNGNVTLSARDGNQGHVEPVPDSSLQSGVQLLAGSGIANGVMTANVRCSTCKLNSGTGTSTSSPWIAAWMPGSALDSTSNSATIMQHDFDATRQFIFDLSQASLSSDANPFVASASTSGSATSGTSPSATGGVSMPTTTSSSSSSASVIGPDPSSILTYQKAHGIIMGVTVVLLFPLGSIFMRLVGSPLIHSLIQILALAMLIAGFALGVRLADMLDYLYKSMGKTHTIFGTVIFAFFLIQPFLGMAHHAMYKKHQARTAVSHTHIWFGRIVMILAIVNGGLGLQLADNSQGGKIAYGVVAGVMALIYAATVALKRTGKSTVWKGEKKTVTDGSS